MSSSNNYQVFKGTKATNSRAPIDKRKLQISQDNYSL